MDSTSDDKDNLRIVMTDDGSQTVFDKQLDTTYHSTHGAVTESQQVYIQAGLRHVLKNRPDSIQILEMGFGTGLNALLSYLVSFEPGVEIKYFGIEATPLPSRIVEGLDYVNYLNFDDRENFFEQAHTHGNFSNDCFELAVLWDRIEQVGLPQGNTLVYYDAFGPTDQSELWELDVLSKVVGSLAPNGVLVTYCAQGQFKRNLKFLGCEVESLPGPPGKREIVRATLRMT
jgi:tRNA U34 5-methylaminomethyl-2-thiouridine-forming methyltransferase MnmC